MAWHKGCRGNASTDVMIEQPTSVEPRINHTGTCRVSETLPTIEQGDAMECDRCSSRAYVFVTLDTGLPLAFCGHCYRANEEALFPYAIEVQDERHMLEA